jgi:ubiquinone/menaquinone biosynthesis C-methylase UbiE
VSGTPESAAYDGSAWSAGPQRIYDRLAERAVALLPGDLTESSALDAGAGTGALTRALLRRGAQVEATDLSADMLEELVRQTQGTVPTTIADVRALPMADASYDVSAAAFVITHLPDPHAALAELSRVTRPGGWLLATSFGTNDHPVKNAIDDVLTKHGWQPPEWYVEVKSTTMPLTGTVAALHAVGAEAGLTSYRVDEIVVEFGDLTPAVVAAYRLGMGQSAPFIAALSDAERAQLTGEAIEAVRQAPPLALAILVLLAEVEPH